ncbi:MAG: hypothetical protein AMS24_03040 [Chlamydiae bacterium SM23_39]|nr:MAG: hypothetical protein AMS24_03040 [Chlamydiae bacterium SM23_39]
MKRATWGSKIGFILSASGAAIGLGNIQRFPYLTAEGGGALFVFIYLICVIFIGLPLILVEFSLGRYAQKNPVCAIEKIKPNYKWIGYLGILTAFFILTYYSVVGGWAIGYVINMIFNLKIDIFNFAANPLYAIGYMALFFTIVMLVVMRGIRRGIERYNKILMPILFFLIIILMVKSLTLKGSFEGVKYYLKPDFSEINTRIFLLALGQAFFSLCIGEAVLITYGSYASKKENLASSALYIAFFDTLIAMLIGFVIFPAIFSFGETPTQGVLLSFYVLPKIFSKMVFGNIFGSLFFILLSFAAVTTAIALLEMPVAYLIDKKRWNRRKAVWIVGMVAFVLGIPSALSKGGSRFLSDIKFNFIKQKGFYDIMDFVWGNLSMVLGGGFLAFFVGWIWGAERASEELKIGCERFIKIKPFWIFIVKFLAPVFIFIILLSLFW